MALATEQQETMFGEPQEAVASFEAELENEAAETVELGTADADALEFPTEPETSVASAAPEEPVSIAPAAPIVEPAPTVEAAPVVEAAAPAPEPESVTAPESPVPPVEEPPPASVESLPILTAADFSGLEERVLRAVSLVRREREARIAAEERSVVLEGRIKGLQLESAEVDRLKEEIEILRAEREQVRLRVERLLGQLDSLEF